MGIGMGMTTMTAQEASQNLARLIERQLNYDKGHVDPVALRLFMLAYWDRLSSLAHIIHADQ